MYGIKRLTMNYVSGGIYKTMSFYFLFCLTMNRKVRRKLINTKATDGVAPYITWYTGWSVPQDDVNNHSRFSAAKN